jgi:hypothetical protein
MPPGTAREASKLRPHHRSYGPECSDGEFTVSLLPAFALAANRAVEYRAERYAADLLGGVGPLHGVLARLPAQRWLPGELVAHPAPPDRAARLRRARACPDRPLTAAHPPT